MKSICPERLWVRRSQEERHLRAAESAEVAELLRGWLRGLVSRVLRETLPRVEYGPIALTSGASSLFA